MPCAFILVPGVPSSRVQLRPCAKATVCWRPAWPSQCCCQPCGVVTRTFASPGSFAFGQASHEFVQHVFGIRSILMIPNSTSSPAMQLDDCHFKRTSARLRARRNARDQSAPECRNLHVSLSLQPMDLNIVVITIAQHLRIPQLAASPQHSGPASPASHFQRANGWTHCAGIYTAHCIILMLMDLLMHSSSIIKAARSIATIPVAVPAQPPSALMQVPITRLGCFLCPLPHYTTAFILLACVLHWPSAAAALPQVADERLAFTLSIIRPNAPAKMLLRFRYLHGIALCASISSIVSPWPKAPHGCNAVFSGGLVPREPRQPF